MRSILRAFRSSIGRILGSRFTVGLVDSTIWTSSQSSRVEAGLDRCGGAAASSTGCGGVGSGVFGTWSATAGGDVGAAGGGEGVRRSMSPGEKGGGAGDN